MNRRYANQYLICRSDAAVEPPGNFHGTDCRNGFSIHRSDVLPLTEVDGTSSSVVVLGDAVVSNEGDTVEEVLEAAVDEPFDELLRVIQEFTGRYVLVYFGRSSTTVVPDALAHKTVYYHEHDDIVTSSPKLYLDTFGRDRELDPEIAALLRTDQFRRAEQTILGNRSVVSGLCKVLPNHVLDLDRKTVHRRPLYPPNVTEPIAEYCSSKIATAITRFVDDHRVYVPLTAGWDSRQLLACSNRVVDDVHLFTFATGIGLEHPDVTVPHRIANDLSLDYSVHHAQPLTNEFKTKLRSEYVRPRFLQKTRNVQYEFDNRSQTDDLRLTGNGGELLRGRPYFQPADGDAVPSASTAAEFVGYGNNDLATTELREWLSGATEYSTTYGIPVLDLLYWEQRMGNWGARMPYERDVAVRTVSPFSNYNLLLAAMETRRRERGPPDYVLAREIIATNWERLLSYEFNPRSGSIKRELYDRSPFPLDRMLEACYRRVAE